VKKRNLKVDKKKNKPDTLKGVPKGATPKGTPKGPTQKGTPGDKKKK